MFSELQTLLRNEGISHERTEPHYPESNGKFERLQRTLIDMDRCNLRIAQHVTRPKKKSEEAVNDTYVSLNRMYESSGNIQDKNQFEAIMNVKLNLDFEFI